jgi:hypothetical protein
MVAHARHEIRRTDVVGLDAADADTFWTDRCRAASLIARPPALSKSGRVRCPRFRWDACGRRGARRRQTAAPHQSQAPRRGGRCRCSPVIGESRQGLALRCSSCSQAATCSRPTATSALACRAACWPAAHRRPSKRSGRWTETAVHPCQRSSRAGSIALVVDAATAPPEADSPSPQSPRASGARADADQGSRLRQAARGWHGLRQSGLRTLAGHLDPQGNAPPTCWERVRVRRSASDTVAELSRLARRVVRRVAVAARRWAGIALRRCGRSRSRATKEGRSMQADEAQAFGMLAGEARAGTVSLVEELDQAVFTWAVATAGPATKGDCRRRRGGCLCGGWGCLSRTRSRRQRGACARPGGRERSPRPGGEVRPRARADALGVAADRACARIVEGASR